MFVPTAFDTWLPCWYPRLLQLDGSLIDSSIKAWRVMVGGSDTLLPQNTTRLLFYSDGRRPDRRKSPSSALPVFSSHVLLQKSIGQKDELVFSSPSSISSSLSCFRFPRQTSSSRCRIKRTASRSSTRLPRIRQRRRLLPAPSRSIRWISYEIVQ